MILTLYKQCILSNSYSEVFDVIKTDAVGKTAFDRYLETLTHSTPIDVDNVYLTNQGKFTIEYDFDNTSIAYDYNYLKLYDDDNEISRYAFIDDMTIVNGLVVINYTEDTWHTYASSMHVRKSLLTRSRLTSYVNGQTTWNIPFYAPSMTYEGNNAPIIKDIVGNIIDPTVPVAFKQAGLIVQLQVYDTVQEGVASGRSIVSCYLKHYSSVTSIEQNYWFYSRLSEDIMKLIQNSSNTDPTFRLANEETPSKRYEIFNIMVVPSQLELIEHGTNYLYGDITLGTITYKFYLSGFVYDRTTVLDGGLFKFKTIQLSNDFKLLSGGTLSKQIEIVSNGSPVNVDLYISYSEFDTKLFIGIQNKIIDITSEFILNLPISVQTSDITQQQATARELAIFNGEMQKAQGVANTTTGGLNAVLGMGQIAGGVLSGNLGMGLRGAGQISNSISQLTSGITSIESGNKAIEIANRSMYTTNKGIQVMNDAFVNSYFGIIFVYTNADNTTEVQANIDNTGYVVNEIVDDIVFRNDNVVGESSGAIKYNTVQFDFANIYGNFPQRVVRKLKDILYNGLKIWYTKDV